MKRLDLKEQRYGRLVVNRPGNMHGRRTSWICQCDCGNEIDVETSNLRMGNTTSCGCYHNERLCEQNRRYAKGSGESAMHSLFRVYQRDAVKAGRQFELTVDEFRRLTSGSCHYCGIQPSTVRKAVGQNGDYIYNGIDRIDSSLGYVTGNCVSCCKRCNQAKNNMTVEEFYVWVKRVFGMIRIERAEVCYAD